MVCGLTMQKHKRLILLAHGSRRPAWRVPFDALAARLGDGVALAFLEGCAPSLAETVAQAAADGVTQVAVLPVFWSSGGHVARDVPALVEAAEGQGVTIEVLPAVGEHPLIIAALEQIAAAHTR